MAVIGRTNVDAVEELTSSNSIFVRVWYVYYVRCERRIMLGDRQTLGYVWHSWVSAPTSIRGPAYRKRSTLSLVGFEPSASSIGRGVRGAAREGGPHAAICGATQPKQRLRATYARKAKEEWQT